ncbi:hypothetical protein KR059_005025 [Drosophila kikkawai]|nr:hypothetical protein KR059_005025 [Drosophila kikkawai]
MSKLAVLFALVCLLAAVQAQTREPTPREICQTVNERCLSRVPVHRNRSEVTDILNGRCRRRHRGWRNITRCELARATCQLTIERCATLSCKNIREALAGDRATTTRRTPASTTTRRPST